MSIVSFDIDPLYEFRAELGAIASPMYLEIAQEALSKVPHYFWLVPASSSGKYHPKSSLGIGGLLRHVRSVFAISEELLSHKLYGAFNEDTKDEIRVAILLHDACKQGISNTPGHTVTEHPLLVRGVLYPNDMENRDPGTQVTDAWDRICLLIETHMGVWTQDKDGNEVLDVPQSQAQLFVHMCDYLASRKIIEVDITPREAQDGNYGKKDWRVELATDGQVNYIKKLLYDCSRSNKQHSVNLVLTDTHGKRVLTKGVATDAINTLKEALGI